MSSCPSSRIGSNNWPDPPTQAPIPLETQRAEPTRPLGHQWGWPQQHPPQKMPPLPMPLCQTPKMLRTGGQCRLRQMPYLMEINQRAELTGGEATDNEALGIMEY
jgi:hypothetical protein